MRDMGNCIRIGTNTWRPTLAEAAAAAVAAFAARAARGVRRRFSPDSGGATELLPGGRRLPPNDLCAYAPLTRGLITRD
jgi:hypothetical protein